MSEPIVPATTATIAAPSSSDDFDEPDTPAADAQPKPTETVDFWKQKAREQEKRAKDNAKAAQKLAEYEAANQSEMEKVVNAAKQEGYSAALREANERAAGVLLRSMLSGRGKDEAGVAAILRGINPAGFITDDDVDDAAIAAFVDSIAPARSAAFPDLAQGDRGGNSKPPNMNDIIRGVRK